MDRSFFIFSGLGVILVLVLVMPFLSKRIEKNLEIFLFAMGISATLVSGAMDSSLAIRALKEPILITAAVFSFGMVFKIFVRRIDASINFFYKRIPPPLMFFMIVVVPGMFSSAITAIISSLVLVETINVLKLDRKNEIRLVVLSCYSIGLGAALTPLGEPLSTIAISKLHQDFWYLLGMLGAYIIPGIVVLGLLAAFTIRGQADSVAPLPVERKDTYGDVFSRAFKIYLFIMALVFLGEGAKPAIDRTIPKLSDHALYWLNMSSAVLDNATLTAMEITDKMSHHQVVAVLMGLLISGGMLIPGNIPNIISAGRLKIGTREWAKVGVPIGIIMMVAYFIIIFT